ncbi:MAG: MBL fold metallo-hydrolase [Deltaproteobacteria bacterium HGW-Deltaproteobacteria-14]|jgi:flavorubredoxin|nr:MAG: MBL fold metallo-hydrolase [Deltaproteobacteria bacterium HGW-Deltaproteobacteria-14]
MAITLFDGADHANIWLEDLDLGEAVQANQHMIIHGREAMLLDPGGPKTFRHAYPEALSLLGHAKITRLFLSHQDPDIVAALNPWLASTNAIAHVSRLWMRFLPHFGLDRVMAQACHPIPDEGGVLDLDGAELIVIPAHYLHSAGNFQVYDPTSKILYSGDLGASFGNDYHEVTDFDRHLEHMAGFHRRYMANATAVSRWAALARQLDIEIIAPQHGACLRGRELVARFIDWCDGLPCGTDLLEPYAMPTTRLN